MERTYELYSEETLRDKVEGLTDFEKAMTYRVSLAEFQRMGTKTVICLLKLHNGFEVVGTAAAANAEHFQWDIGKACSLREALHKLGELATYEQANKDYHARAYDSAGQ